MNYAVLDLETTGHSTEDDILQVGVVIVSDQLEIISTFSAFVKPTIPIPPFITQLTGIDESMVKDAPELNDVLLQLIPLLDDAVLVAHNVGFDAGFLNQALDRCGYMPFTGRRLDTVELLRILYPSITTYQLGAVAEQFGIANHQHHRADSDAMATAQIFIDLVNKLRSMPLLTVQRLSALIDESKDLHWFLKHTEKHVEQETVFDSNEYDYHRQFALKAREWSEEKHPRGEVANQSENPLAEMSFEQYLAEIKERFQSRFENYEEREAQTTMFNEVYDALSTNKHLLIEAGTGTGKSLGYLIPALYYSIKNNSKIVVSTHTINLQEQLRQRDLPLLGDVLPFPFKASIFKGRGNYLCLRKFEGKLNVGDLVAPIEDSITAAQMVVWLSETETGDQEELNFGSRGADFWGTVSSDADSCLNRACPWFKRCYYHRAKHEANLADVCITNHSMLFTDVQADHRLLPAYSNLIIDEAHHVEEVAGKHLGMQVHYFTLVQAIIRLYKDNRSGLLPSLKFKLEQEDDDHQQSWLETIETIIPIFQEIKEHWDKLFELLYNFAANGSDSMTDNGSLVKRLTSTAVPEGWEEVVAVEGNIHVELSRVIKTSEKLLTDIKDRIDDISVQASLTDLNGALRDLSRVKDELRHITKLDSPQFVYWIEASTAYRHRSVQLYAAPVDVSEQLQKYFFDVKDSIVLTSATLTVQKSFQYAQEQLGLTGYEEQGRLRTVLLSSPFNYREQALVVIPRDFPILKGAYVDDAYLQKLVGSIADTANQTKGRMLVLFTSYKLLKQVYDPLKNKLDEVGIGLLGQGIDSSNRTKLTRRFLQQPQSVLLGTSSFWEGVDIPGEGLICLAIVRLPFQPPNHPLVEAKSEMLKRQGQNPFMKLSIPQAVIRFKQGFGRLVRTSQDKGIVIIYDTRVIDTYYGKHFLYSLPGPKIESMHTDQMVPRMREWLADTGKHSDEVMSSMKEE
ncbi:ATP-dependent DNA helicase DinG [Paenibacillus sp. GSMTC-2017]|uniref:ATP-dependent DNA helicase DinG n=1 Tax=Paenibacillus sp. GSMTC-2017 TaxID=2794350 RepID=UPI0018D9CEA8|nr:ATP-dependent DNA helicase DinG [Paenibacillus sp. GSMTC-2017]MBH5317918.1 ATP-dependent DNA helicase DinG [Paenibacillus sp. GSMTC-2017]